MPGIRRPASDTKPPLAFERVSTDSSQGSYGSLLGDDGGIIGSSAPVSDEQQQQSVLDELDAMIPYFSSSPSDSTPTQRSLFSIGKGRKKTKPAATDDGQQARDEKARAANSANRIIELTVTQKPRRFPLAFRRSKGEKQSDDEPPPIAATPHRPSPKSAGNYKLCSRPSPTCARLCSNDDDIYVDTDHIRNALESTARRAPRPDPPRAKATSDTPTKLQANYKRLSSLETTEYSLKAFGISPCAQHSQLPVLKETQSSLTKPPPEIPSTPVRHVRTRHAPLMGASPVRVHGKGGSDPAKFSRLSLGFVDPQEDNPFAHDTLVDGSKSVRSGGSKLLDFAHIPSPSTREPTWRERCVGKQPRRETIQQYIIRFQQYRREPPSPVPKYASPGRATATPHEFRIPSPTPLRDGPGQLENLIFRRETLAPLRGTNNDEDEDVESKESSKVFKRSSSVYSSDVSVRTSILYEPEPKLEVKSEPVALNLEILRDTIAKRTQEIILPRNDTNLDLRGLPESSVSSQTVVSSSRWEIAPDEVCRRLNAEPVVDLATFDHGTELASHPVLKILKKNNKQTKPEDCLKKVGQELQADGCEIGEDPELAVRRYSKPRLIPLGLPTIAEGSLPLTIQPLATHAIGGRTTPTPPKSVPIPDWFNRHPEGLAALKRVLLILSSYRDGLMGSKNVSCELSSTPLTIQPRSFPVSVGQEAIERATRMVPCTPSPTAVPPLDWSPTPPLSATTYTGFPLTPDIFLPVLPRASKGDRQPAARPPSVEVGDTAFYSQRVTAMNGSAASLPLAAGSVFDPKSCGESVFANRLRKRFSKSKLNNDGLTPVSFEDIPTLPPIPARYKEAGSAPLPRSQVVAAPPALVLDPGSSTPASLLPDVLSPITTAPFRTPAIQDGSMSIRSARSTLTIESMSTPRTPSAFWLKHMSWWDTAALVTYILHHRYSKYQEPLTAQVHNVNVNRNKGPFTREKLMSTEPAKVQSIEEPATKAEWEMAILTMIWDRAIQGNNIWATLKCLMGEFDLLRPFERTAPCEGCKECRETGELLATLSEDDETHTLVPDDPGDLPEEGGLGEESPSEEAVLEERLVVWGVAAFMRQEEIRLRELRKRQEKEAAEKAAKLQADAARAEEDEEVYWRSRMYDRIEQSRSARNSPKHSPKKVKK